MKTLINILIIFLLFTYCSKKSEINYEIISEKEHVNKDFGINKCNIDIMLPKKVSNEELTIIAQELRESRNSYDRLWIFYHIKGNPMDKEPWASTHFTPNLEVVILGSTESEDKIMQNVKIEGNIIGKWKDDRPYVGCVISILEKEKKTFMKFIYQDGSSFEKELSIKKLKGKNRYYFKENTHNEYFIIESNGNLGMYGKDGKFTEAVNLD